MIKGKILCSACLDTLCCLQAPWAQRHEKPQTPFLDDCSEVLGSVGGPDCDEIESLSCARLVRPVVSCH
jgi:hypothetical protein